MAGENKTLESLLIPHFGDLEARINVSGLLPAKLLEKGLINMQGLGDIETVGAAHRKASVLLKLLAPRPITDKDKLYEALVETNQGFLVEEYFTEEPAVAPIAAGDPSGGGGDAVAERDVFLSYTWRDDKAAIERFAKRLKDSGYTYWLDTEQMHGSITGAMGRGIEGAKVVVMFISQNYQDSLNCMREAEYSSQCKKKIIAVKMQRFDPSGSLGVIVGNTLWVHFNERDEEDTYQQVKRQIDMALRA